ncbi:MAG: 50S ribosomal protein L10, partial [Methanobacterium paludis]|nr:50S ribosomal protein L10 [Methanobacterium paludis]
TRELLLAKAYSQMLAVAGEVSAKNADAVDEELQEKLSSQATSVEAKKDKEEPKDDEDEESEEEKEEDAAAGLGALFG